MSKNNELLNCQFRSLVGCLSTHEKHHLLNVTRKEIGVDISKNSNGFKLDNFFSTKDRKTQEKEIRLEMKRLRSHIRYLKSEVGNLKNELKEIV